MMVPADHVVHPVNPVTMEPMVLMVNKDPLGLLALWAHVVQWVSLVPLASRVPLAQLVQREIRDRLVLMVPWVNVVQ